MPELAIAPLSAPPVQTATDQVFEALYSAVVSLQLPPGTKVSEAEIARQLDVSRQPVRDAFFRLSQLGFLLIRPQRATLVTRISERAVLEAVFVRTALELECARRAIEIATDSDIADLRACLSRQAAVLATNDRSLFHAEDDGFHQTICRIAGHEGVWDLIKEQKAHMDRVRFLSLSESRQRSVIDEHTALVEAIAARDKVRTEQLMRTHLGDIRKVVANIRSEHGAFFEDGAE